MKLTRLLLLLVSLFAWKVVRMECRDGSQRDEGSFSNEYKKTKENKGSKYPEIIEYSSRSDEPTSESEYESDADQNLSVSVVVHKPEKQYSDIKTYDAEWEPNVFQKIRVPVGGPYCYPEKVDQVKHKSKSSRKIRHTPELREKATASFPIGITETVWPYELNQTQKKKEIRKFIPLKVSPDRYEETYRYIGQDAERAFISRYYGFINPSKNNRVDDLITLIDDFEKIAGHLALDTGPDPLADFNSWSMAEKIKFCEKYINYNVILLNQNIDFDSSDPTKIIRKHLKILYNHSLLEEVEDIVDAVVCPCKENTQNPLELAVLPIRYKYPDWHDFPFAFVYNILEDSEKEPNAYEANVRALVKIDEKGLAKKREKRNRKLKELQKINQKEEKKLRQKLAENNGNVEKEKGSWPRALKKLLLSKDRT